MNQLFIYLIKSGLTLTILYIMYWLLLRKGTHFKLNRSILILTILSVFILPLFTQIAIWQFFESSNIKTFSLILDEITITGLATTQTNSGININWSVVLLYIYIIGALITLIRLIYQGIYLHIMARLGKVIYKNERLKVIEVNSEITPFAYFNKVYIPASSFEKQHLNTIILHEKTHLEQYHFADILLVQILTISQWFNPIAWMLEKTLKEVHEYLADEAVLKQGQDKGIYQAQLINQVLGGPVFSITNSFNNSLIKKRIVMMTKMKTSRMAQLKVLFFVPVLVILLVAFANPKSSIVLDKNAFQKDSTNAKSTHIDEKIYTQVEQSPDYPSGALKMVEFFKNNVKYPEEAKKKGITGRIFVQFIVNQEGKIKDAKVIRSVDKLLDAEALRVINAMPDWKPAKKNGKPVNFQMTVPINFALK